MGTAWLIAIKDLRLRLRDRSAFVLGVIAPLGLAFIFNLVLGDVVEGEFVPAFAIVDDDGGDVAAGFVGALEEIGRQGVIGLQAASNVDAAEALIDGGTVSAAFVIPEGFSSSVRSAGPAQLVVLGDPNSPTSVEIARSIARGFAAEIEAVQLSVATVAATADQSLSPQELQTLGERAQGVPDPIAVGQVEAATRQLDLSTFFAASMSVFFLFFTVAFGASGLLEERQQGTITRLMAAPVAGVWVVVGKALVSFILGIVSMTLLVIASSLLLGADWGNPVGVALLIIAGVLAATGVMTVVAAFAKTPEQAGNLQAILAVGLGMLGGIFFPADLGTGLLANLAYISPHRWFMTGLNDLAGGGGMSVIVPSLLGLLAFAAAGWGLAAFRFREGLRA